MKRSENRTTGKQIEKNNSAKLSPAEETSRLGPKGDWLEDYVSGKLVRKTAEEADAVQVFARRLVEDYGYSKNQIQTHPQFRVRKRPSDEEKSYPVDIAVFRTKEKTEDNLFIIIECKQKNRKAGMAQLKLYMDMSPAEVGGGFNGQEHIYLRKVIYKDGRRAYQELPSLFSVPAGVESSNPTPVVEGNRGGAPAAVARADSAGGRFARC